MKEKINIAIVRMTSCALDNRSYEQEEEVYLSDSDLEDASSNSIPYYEQTVKDIQEGNSYVCMICTVELDPSCQMYACQSCYRVYDYDCVREWALKSTAKTTDKSWKCPNCYKVHHKVPAAKRNTCWCGKVVRPDINELNPNSCGQTCNANTCVHGCSKICHLGPHPECLIPIAIKCKCGKHSQQVPCFQSKKLGNTYECDDVCGLMMPCGKHTCTKRCHGGFCGECDNTIESELVCYCGSESKANLRCSDLEFVDYSQDIDGNRWVGVYSCEKMRTLKYSCGEHTYVEACRAPPSIDLTKPCPYLPKYLKTCPCGKTKLTDLTKPRRKCTEPIPTCYNKCGKALACGKHLCPFNCHTGACMDPCVIIDKVKCACHSKTYLTPCQFHESPRCNIKCESNMSCRRHKCFNLCCPGKPLAKKREKSLFLTKDRNDETLVESEHICLKQCNLKLSCGIHDCTWKCHPGKCPPCLESDSNDLVCPCGKTMVPAPVRCGTKLPPCPHPCIRISQGSAPCGHKIGPHKCHPLDKECPPCTASVLKRCKCSKHVELRTLCLVPDEQVSCGIECGEILTDCHHRCRKKCHAQGDCEDKCKAICGLIRKSCQHTCTALCHGSSPCPELPCHETVMIRCQCGRKTEAVECGATIGTPSRSQNDTAVCDEDCLASQRKVMLMEAFGIDQRTTTSKEHLEYLLGTSKSFEDLKMPYTELTLNVYHKQKRWCDQIVEILDRFMGNEGKLSLHFKPMRAPQRQFVHELCKSYFCYSESQDPEPNRSVYVKKIPNQSRKPTLLLPEAAELFQRFKQLEKNRLQEYYENKVTKTLVNVQISEDPVQNTYNGPNALEIILSENGSYLDRIKETANGFLRYSLLKNPQYLENDQRKSILVFPEDHLTLTETTANDLVRVSPFIQDALQQQMLASKIELCRLDEDFNIVHSPLVISEESLQTDPENSIFN